MMIEAKLTRVQAKEFLNWLYPEYKGRKITAVQTDYVAFYNTNWCGGTKNTYRCINLLTGEVNGLPIGAPWENPVEGATISLPQNVVVGVHTDFCGHDLGVQFRINPQMNPETRALLPLFDWRPL